MNAEQAEPGSLYRRIEAMTVVRDAQMQLGTRDDADLDRDSLGSGVTQCVRQRFLHDTVDVRGHIGLDLIAVAVDIVDDDDR